MATGDEVVVGFCLLHGAKFDVADSTGSEGFGELWGGLTDVEFVLGEDGPCVVVDVHT